MQPEIIIIGAGLTGLSAAYNLQKLGYSPSLYEKEKSIGGLCRSFRKKGFTFDFTGHLLHFKKHKTIGLLKYMLSDNLLKVHRRAEIFSFNRFTEYPFQVHTYGLPENVILECVNGYIDSYTGGPHKNTPADFHEWVIRNFGKGIAKYFMVPYNRKLWTLHPSMLNTEWIRNYVPNVSVSDVIKGALGLAGKGYGYNASFYYPRKGGVQSLCDGFGEKIKDIRPGHELVSVDTAKKKIFFKNGQKRSYDVLISTGPLKELITDIYREPSSEMLSAAKRLRCTSVLNLNIGISRPAARSSHWIYFPEGKYPFYRIGLPSNLSSDMSPKEKSSLSLEIAYSPWRPLGEMIIKRCIENLVKTGFMSSRKDLLFCEPCSIDHAYVIYDSERKRCTSFIRERLNSEDVFCIGRYGAWEYSTMEDAIEQGERISQVIHKRFG